MKKNLILVALCFSMNICSFERPSKRPLENENQRNTRVKIEKNNEAPSNGQNNLPALIEPSTDVYETHGPRSAGISSATAALLETMMMRSTQPLLVKLASLEQSLAHVTARLDTVEADLQELKKPAPAWNDIHAAVRTTAQSKKPAAKRPSPPTPRTFSVEPSGPPPASAIVKLFLCDGTRLLTSLKGPLKEWSRKGTAFESKIIAAHNIFERVLDNGKLYTAKTNCIEDEEGRRLLVSLHPLFSVTNGFVKHDNYFLFAVGPKLFYLRNGFDEVEKNHTKEWGSTELKGWQGHQAAIKKIYAVGDMVYSLDESGTMITWKYKTGAYSTVFSSMPNSPAIPIFNVKCMLAGMLTAVGRAAAQLREETSSEARTKREDTTCWFNPPKSSYACAGTKEGIINIFGFNQKDPSKPQLSFNLVNSIWLNHKKELFGISYDSAKKVIISASIDEDLVATPYELPA